MEISTRSNSSSAHNNGLCRVCLAANEDNKCIFAAHKNLDNDNYSFSNLWEKLQFYGGIEVCRFVSLLLKFILDYCKANWFFL